MWRRCLLSGMAAWLAAAAPAAAFIAYVSNEKSNTVSVIDTDNWTVTKTIKVGQRPRGIEFTRDGKFVMVAVGDDDTIQVIDTKTQAGGGHPALRSRPGAVHPGCRRQDALRRQRERQHGDHHRSREARPPRRHPGRRRARGHGDQPGRQDPDQHVRDHQHGAFHRHRDAPDRRQRAGRCAAALCRVQARRLRVVGVVGDRRHRVGHRSGQARGDRQDHLRDSGPAAAKRSSRSASA